MRTLVLSDGGGAGVPDHTWFRGGEAYAEPQKGLLPNVKEKGKGNLLSALRSAWSGGGKDSKDDNGGGKDGGGKDGGTEGNGGNGKARATIINETLQQPRPRNSRPTRHECRLEPNLRLGCREWARIKT